MGRRDIMNSMHHLVTKEDDQKRLQTKFDDKRIKYGWNRKSKQYQVWYVPSSSRPYMVCFAVNVEHAMRQMEARMRADKMRAKDLLAEIDAHNDKIVTDEQQDAMCEVRSELRKIASGRQYFTV